MSLAAGTRLGAYEIVSLLGAGGMGEVYRARDLKLDRAVAIKILPDHFATDAERVVRFEREAKALASLNHPHIAQIYGFEQSGKISGLVMELVEGEDLSQRLARGAISLVDALPLAKQIAEALEAAHEQGIVHRDLKPANIKIRDDGTVKVLDFGLAKALNPASGADLDPMASPTVSDHATKAGAILGTAAYMSPEQAKGREVDKRADLWAFGAVLYEMLTGRRAFIGDGASDTIARVLLEEPDWSALPAGTPGPIGALLRRCLEKDRRRRLDSAAAARFAIDDAIAVAAAAPIRVSAMSRLSMASIAAMVGAGVLILAIAVVVMRPESLDPAQPAVFAIVPPPAQPLNLQGDARDIALSPNGRHLVYRSGGSMKGGSPLMLRAIDALDARPLADIDTALAPFFSPDSQWIGFFAAGELRKVSIRGGPVVTICAVTGTSRGAIWGDDDTIIFATSSEKTGLWRVSAAGGAATVLTTPDAAQHETRHSFPFMLPASRSVLFTTTTAASGAADTSQVAVLDLNTGNRKVLIRGASDATYVESGHLVYAAAGALHAVRFDPVRLEAAGDPVPVIEPVMMVGTGAANYAVARNGTLIYVPGGIGAQTTPRLLVWVDRRGREEPIGAPPRPYSSPRLSPDGKQVAVEIFDRNNELWIWDLSRAVLRRLTLDPSFHGMPVWSRDSRRLIFASSRDGRSGLFEQNLDGTGPTERLATLAGRATAITPDGTRVIGFQTRANAQADVVVFSRFARAAAGSEPPAEIRFTGVFAELSPDGRYIAYQSSNESGRIEVYVRPFPQVESGRWQVSTTGGTRPAWAHSGRELFYIDGAGLLIAVPVQTSGTTLTFGNQAKVFDTRYAEPFPARHYDIAPDDQRFLMMKDSNAADPNATPASLVVILNWSERLKARVPQ